MTMPLLEFIDVSFAYEPGKQVLQGLNFVLKERSISVILGPNGVGKTTLLSLALGWLNPLQGHIRLEGKSLPSFTRRELGKRIAMVPQTEHIPYEYSVLEYVLMGRTPHLPTLAMPSRTDSLLAAEALERVGIDHLLSTSMWKISSGERQLALVARALAQEPKILLLDEPTAHLDLGNKVNLLRVLTKLRDQGVTILLTTHEPDIGLILADEVLLMQKAMVLTIGTPGTVLTDENLSQLYQTPVQVVSANGHRQVVWY